MKKIKLANAPCSWGALEFELGGKALACKQVLAEMAELGYVGTELGDWGFMPTDPQGLRKVLDAYGLDLPGAFVPVALANKDQHQNGVEKALRIAKLMVEAGYRDAFIILADENGCVEERTLNAGRITPNMSLKPDEWKVFGDGANKVAKAVKDQYGLKTVFHHHCAGFVETPEELDALMENTDSELVGICLDMGHYAFGGGDPLMVLEKYPDRIWHIHFKDFDPKIGQKSRDMGWDYFQSVQHGVFCKLGEGAVNFDAIIQKLEAMDYSGWIVVEQDVLPGMGSPFMCAKHNLEFIQKNMIKNEVKP
ncbi:sugar phosphate isomerase/epimerase [Echinicola jeungdonensis]|uniref:Sugar phosphate isomerase/epimerase family protein n=1 Tax=Echinicola jeungdonensis TaxID=709343 RepID=A0ABV5J9N1_9BACT|nr:sugar phosphate isomerase/epimerase [Echinicola jeungdonensis]MDN3670371.1 sugar phosphate isomerase/epimerase [Echinicola jeungdonensis]